MNPPLHGIRVLDITQMVAGPLCTMILGDLGADVIKVEPPEGDSIRRTGETFVGGSTETESVISVNRNKRSIVVDLKTDRGRELLRKLAMDADVFVENSRSGATDRLGIGYKDLSAVNPRLIYCSVTGFGSASANSHRPAMDQIVQALSGLMQLTGTEATGPLRTGFPVADIITPYLATVGILSALRVRDETGRGQKVEVSMMNATLFSMVPREAFYFATGKTPARKGNAHYQIVPCNTYETADGRQIMILAHTEKFWDAIVAAVRDPELATDPRFRKNKDRLKNREAVEQRLTAEFRSAPLSEWMERLDAAGAIFAPVRNWNEVFSDPEVKRDMLVELDHPTAGRVTVLNNPLKFSETKLAIDRPPPLLGEHTDEILKELENRRRI